MIERHDDGTTDAGPNPRATIKRKGNKTKKAPELASPTRQFLGFCSLGGYFQVYPRIWEISELLT